MQLDQSQDLVKRGINAAFINSTTGKKETKRIYGELESGRLKLLFVAPETLLKENEYGEKILLDYLSTQCYISHIVLDEAHGVVESSQDFRPKYKQLGVLKEYFPEVNIACYTATATPSDILEIATSLGIQDSLKLIDHQLHRENLHYTVLRKTDEVAQMMGVVRQYPKGTSGLIYCNTKDKCKQVSEYLNRQGFKAEFFYSTLSKKDKSRVLEGFLDGSIPIVVATTAFGTGINRGPVRFVLNLDTPSGINDMVQQLGRSGRDGEVSKCYTLYSPQDLNTLKYILRMSISSPNRLKKAYDKLDEVSRFCMNKSDCRSSLILNHFGQTLSRPCGTCDNCLRDIQ